MDDYLLIGESKNIPSKVGFVMFALSYCPYCNRAEDHLKRNNQEYIRINVDLNGKKSIFKKNLRQEFKRRNISFPSTFVVTSDDMYFLENGSEDILNFDYTRHLPMSKRTLQKIYSKKLQNLLR